MAAIEVTNISEVKYTGETQKPEVEVRYNGNLLKRDIEYSVSYENNVNAGEGAVIIKGKGEYVGTKKITFKIQPIDISNLSFSHVENMMYTGEEIRPEIAVSKDAVSLKTGKDYTVTYINNISAGSAYVIVNGVGNYTGVKSILFEIKPITEVKKNNVVNLNLNTHPTNLDKKGTADDDEKGEDNLLASNFVVRGISDQTYVGEEITPIPMVYYGDLLLTSGSDYTISYKDNINVGVSTITIEGLGKYVGNKQINFNIIPLPMYEVSVWMSGREYYTGEEIEPYVYYLEYISYTLEENKDYTLEYENNINVGTGTVIITGKGNFIGTIEENFNIVKRSAQDFRIIPSYIPYQTYIGDEIEPITGVMYQENTLTAGVDYTISYLNNVNSTNVGGSSAPYATCMVTGIGLYDGVRSINFGISQINIDDLTINYTQEYIYTGSEIEFDIVLKNGDVTLLRGTDYTISQTSYVNAGSYNIYINGKGNYIGFKSLEIKILPRIIDIPDVNFKQALIDAGVDSNGDSDIDTSEALRTYVLDIPDNSISSILGIEYFKYLGTLYLNNNLISDISPLEGLTNMRALYLNNNLISNISPLQDLTDISSLYLNSNSISDITCLEGLVKIDQLGLDYNNLEDISSLLYLTNLENVSFNQNKLNISYLRTYDINTVNVITTLISRGVYVGGYLDYGSCEYQSLTYDASQIIGKPKHKVLFVIISEIDAMAGDKHIQITLDDEQKEYFRLLATQSEKVIEKLSDYAVDIEGTIYETTNTVTEYQEDGDSFYSINAHMLDEIETIRDGYDTIIVYTLYNNDVNHRSSGFELFVLDRGFINVHVDEMDNGYDIMTIAYRLKQLKRYGQDLKVLTTTHEFIHSIEEYSQRNGYTMTGKMNKDVNTISGLHTAMGAYGNYEVKCYRDYLTDNLEDGMGIPPTMWQTIDDIR